MTKQPIKSQLDDALEHYQGLDPTQPNAAKTNSATGLGAYSAALGAALAMSCAADASIVYSGVQNVVLKEFDDDFQIDLDGNGGNDLSVHLNLGIYEAFADFQGLNAGSNGASVALSRAFTTTAPPYPLVRRFNSGSIIDSGAVFSTFISTLRGTLINDNTFGNWNLSTSGIAGFKTQNGDFGWIRLNIKNTNGYRLLDELTVVDWAYENSGAAIKAGDSGIPAVPLPGSLVLLASGVAGITAMRRRRRDKGNSDTA